MKKMLYPVLVALLFFSGCGKNHLNIAKGEVEVLKKELEKEAAEKEDLFKPVPVNLAAIRNLQSGRARAIAGQLGREYNPDPGRVLGQNDLRELDSGTADPERPDKGHLQYITGQWRYRFDKPEFFDENDRLKEIFTLRVEGTYLMIYHAPISVEQVKEVEQTTGKYYDPRGTTVQTTRVGKKKEMFYEYNKDTMKWELKKEEITFDVMSKK